MYAGDEKGGRGGSKEMEGVYGGHGVTTSSRLLPSSHRMRRRFGTISSRRRNFVEINGTIDETETRTGTRLPRTEAPY